MRRLLMPSSAAWEVDSYFAKPSAVSDALQKYVVMVAERGGGALGGFIEVGARSFAEGCDSSPVAYIEAWFVDADLRRQGVGGRLLAAAEDWARAEGFADMASDALIDNEISIAAHGALGFAEFGRIAVFAKKL